jgi:RES domain
MSQRPRPHPEPPADFDSLDLPLSRRARRWFRTYRCRREPVFFGTSRSSRFDDPKGKFGVLYLATEFEGAFVEGCLIDSGLGTTGPLLGERFLKSRCLAEIRFSKPLNVVDLTGSGLAAIGADARLSSGDYRIAQRWSRAMWRHPGRPDGILYLSRHNPYLLCAAVFDRAPNTIVNQIGSFLGSGLIASTAALLDKYGVGLC